MTSLNEIQIVIVDDNLDFSKILVEFLSQKEGFKIIGTAADGLEAIDIIKATEPDVVILDIVMPKLDGLGVLEKLQSSNLNKAPQFIMLSAVGNLKTTQIAINLGAEYFMIKPFDLDDLVSRIKQLQSVSYFKEIRTNGGLYPSDYNIDKKINFQITKILDSIGVPSHLKGYQYLKYAINMVVKDLTAINSITKLIYADTALEFKTTHIRVERAIRNAIELTWSRGNINNIVSQLGYKLTEEKTRPTNSEFIIMVADKIWDRFNAF